MQSPGQFRDLHCVPWFQPDLMISNGGGDCVARIATLRRRGRDIDRVSHGRRGLLRSMAASANQ